MNIPNERIKFRTANQRFKRARRLYIFINRHQINDVRDSHLDYVAKRMQGRGLYASASPERSVRQGILSHLFRIECKGKTPREARYTWHGWCMANGWDPWMGYSKPIMMKQA